MLAEGTLAPDFDVLAHDGSRVRLSELAGQHVLVWFYPWLNFRRYRIPPDQIRKLETKNVVVLGATFMDVADNHAYHYKFSYSFKVLSFPTVTGDPWDAGDLANPSAVAYLIGPDRQVIKAYANVEPHTHPAQVLADVTAL